MEKKTSFRALSTKAKVQYIWDYYRIHILCAAAAVGIIFSFAHHLFTYREPILRAILINVQCDSENITAAFAEFSDAKGYDKKEQPIEYSSNLYFTEDDTFHTDYNSYMALSTMIGAGGQDLFLGTGDVFLDYAKQGALLDLRTYLSDELLETYQEYLIYTIEDEETASYPCAIELTDNNWIQTYGLYDTCYFGIFAQSEHTAYAADFAEFLLKSTTLKE